MYASVSLVLKQHGPKLKTKDEFVQFLFLKDLQDFHVFLCTC